MDLKLQLQSYPERSNLDFAACLKEVAAAAKQFGKACGMFCRQTDDFAELQALGFTHLAIETDITLLRESYRNVVQPLRAQSV
jgi:2-dehydro-3-deoxyglucarate aldolase/4-hydroxy-2-oxoheptanedioate aldolase